MQSTSNRKNPQTLPYAAAQTIDFSQSSVFDIGTLTGACVLSVKGLRCGELGTIKALNGAGFGAVTFAVGAGLQTCTGPHVASSAAPGGATVYTLVGSALDNSTADVTSASVT